MIVTLTWAECQAGITAGAMRRLRRIRAGAADRHGLVLTDNDWTNQIEACAAEIAVAKHLDTYWADSWQPDYDGDVGHGTQVRWTPRADGRLILHKSDPGEHLFYLVRGAIPTFDVVGFISGESGKIEKYWTDPGTGRPAYFIPDTDLIPIERTT